MQNANDQFPSTNDQLFYNRVGHWSLWLGHSSWRHHCIHYCIMRLNGNDVDHLAVKRDAPDTCGLIDCPELRQPPVVAAVAAAQTIARRIECDAGDESELYGCEIQCIGIDARFQNAEWSLFQLRKIGYATKGKRSAFGAGDCSTAAQLTSHNIVGKRSLDIAQDIAVSALRLTDHSPAYHLKLAVEY